MKVNLIITLTHKHIVPSAGWIMYNMPKSLKTKENVRIFLICKLYSFMNALIVGFVCVKFKYLHMHKNAIFTSEN